MINTPMLGKMSWKSKMMEPEMMDQCTKVKDYILRELNAINRTAKQHAQGSNNQGSI